MTLKSMVKVKYSLKTVTLLIIQTPLWCIDGLCSYLAQQLRMMCLLKQKISDSRYNLVVKGQGHTYLKPVKLLKYFHNFFIYFDRGCTYTAQCLHIIC